MKIKEITSKKGLNFYHYTIFQHFRSIVETRVIKKATAFCLPSIKTAVWFSTNEDWENTVMKALRNPITGEETKYYSREAFFNCNAWDELIAPNGLHNFIPVRLKLDNESICFGSYQADKVNLRTWNNYKKNSGEPREMLKGLAKVGKQMGANPKEWFVSYDEVSTGHIAIDGYERWDGVNWVEIMMSDLETSYPLIAAA